MSDIPEVRVSNPPQEDEALAWGKIVLVGVAALCCFAATVFWSTNILNTTRAEEQPHGMSMPTEAHPFEVGIVNQKPFALDQRAAFKRNEQLAQLHGYGWVDRKAGIIHIPIEQAMELEVRAAAQKK